MLLMINGVVGVMACVVHETLVGNGVIFTAKCPYCPVSHTAPPSPIRDN